LGICIAVALSFLAHRSEGSFENVHGDFINQGGAFIYGAILAHHSHRFLTEKIGCLDAKSVLNLRALLGFLALSFCSAVLAFRMEQYASFCFDLVMSFLVFFFERTIFDWMLKICDLFSWCFCEKMSTREENKLV
jgi:hypothetical protein